ncbi:hypothetical protein QTP88_012198 [Uroleucon formosanum]
MDDEEVAIFAYTALKIIREKKRLQRKWWVHPINSKRLLHGDFYTLYSRLRADNVSFFNYFRMSLTSFDELFAKIKHKIIRQDTNMRSAIPPEEMLAVTLRYLGSTNNLHDLHYAYRIGRSTLRMEDLDYDNNLYANRSVNRYRDALANYFVSEDGQISWQNEKI